MCSVAAQSKGGGCKCSGNNLLCWQFVSESCKSVSMSVEQSAASPAPGLDVLFCFVHKACTVLFGWSHAIDSMTRAAQECSDAPAADG